MMISNDNDIQSSIEGFVKHRHRVFPDTRSMTSLFFDSQTRRCEVVHSLKYGAAPNEKLHYRSGAVGTPKSSRAAAGLFEKQTEMEGYALTNCERRILLAKAGTALGTRLLNIFGQKFVICEASENQSRAIEHRLHQYFEDLRGYTRSPDEMIIDFAKMLSEIDCEIGKRTA